MGKLLTGLVLLALLLAAVPARGDATDAILDDCAKSLTGLLVHRYDNAELRAALRELRGDMAEYSGCADAIRAQLMDNRDKQRGGGRDGEAGGAGAGGGGGAGAGDGGGGADGLGAAAGGSGGGRGAGAGGACAGGAAGGAGAADGACTDAGGAGAGAFGAGGALDPAAMPPDGTAGGDGAPLVIRRDGFALASGDGRALPTSLLAALVLLAALALAGAGGALRARRR